MLRACGDVDDAETPSCAPNDGSDDGGASATPSRSLRWPDAYADAGLQTPSCDASNPSWPPCGALPDFGAMPRSPGAHADGSPSASADGAELPSPWGPDADDGAGPLLPPDADDADASSSGELPGESSVPDEDAVLRRPRHARAESSEPSGDEACAPPRVTCEPCDDGGGIVMLWPFLFPLHEQLRRGYPGRMMWSF